MRSDDIAITAHQLCKTYRIFGHPGDRIKQAMSFGLKTYHREFPALTDVSLEIEKGQTVGIIGRNGSGKSTLLQLVCGILKPTSGTVRANGRVSALLELGAGFNPEFTGRENVYFQGALMGITKKEMDKRFDEIADFADIGAYIEEPVRTYSSGMFVRLAFAVATSTDPTILIVDEALSVGDVAFQHKSRKRMQDMTNSGVTLLVVSHDRITITALCDQCILLDHGRVMLNGLPSDVFDYYHALVAAKGDQQVSKSQLDNGRLQVVSGSGEARVESIRLLDTAARETRQIDVGEQVNLEFVVRINRPLPHLVLGFSIRDGFGQTVFGTNTNSFGPSLQDPEPGKAYRFNFSFRATLGEGNYSISTALVSTNDRFTDNYECRELAYLIEVRNQNHPAFGGVAWIDPKLAVELL